MKTKDYTGQRFGKLTALEPTNERKKTGNNVIWLCKCDCGNLVKIPTSEFSAKAHTRSCGCWRSEKMTISQTTHGGARERLYIVWMSMRRRCYEKKNKDYPNYGGRGIKVCDLFQDYGAFRKWAFESGYDPNANYGECTLDRIDANGDYEPQNCRWVSLANQNNNKRDNIKILHNGTTKTASEWERELGYSQGLIRDRIRRGWSTERAITQPPATRKIAATVK